MVSVSSSPRTCTAIASANFGPYAHTFEKDDCFLLGDFRIQPRDQLEVYHPSNVATVRKPPVTISEFKEMSNQQTLLIEAAYGIENGKGRRRATDFFVSLHRDSPETYTVEFTVDVWERMSADYMGSIREGIRRMEPYLEEHTANVGMGKVALSPIFNRSGKLVLSDTIRQRGRSIRGNDIGLELSYRNWSANEIVTIARWLLGGTWRDERKIPIDPEL